MSNLTCTCCIILLLYFGSTIKLVASQLHLQPLWNTTTPANRSCSVELHGNHTNQTDWIDYHGISHQTCQLQITSSPGRIIKLQVPTGANQQNFYIYVERLGEPTDLCSSKFVSIQGQAEPCYTLFWHPELQINLQGNVSIILNEIPANQSSCPDEYNNIYKLNNLNPCTSVREYDEIITSCTEYRGYCDLEFPFECENILRNHEVMTQCPSNTSVMPPQIKMIPYPTGIRYLYLTYNNLVGIDVDAFYGLESMEYLNLYGNQLYKYTNSLPAGLFRNLINLRDLQLGYNSLMHLQPGLFDGLKKLSILYLIFNGLSSFPSGLFLDLENLTELYLYVNKFVMLTPDMFVGLHQLSDISFGGNPLETVSPGSFTDLGNLQVLVLRGNNIASLQSGVFHELLSLETLFMNYNLLMSLHGDLFRGLVNVNTLFLNYNQIKYIGTGIFQGLVNLQMLSLSQNQLTNLDNDIFSTNMNLVFIDLADNRLTKIPNLHNLQYIKFINLKGSELSKISNNTFFILKNGSEILVSQHEICQCYIPKDVDCSAADTRSPYLTCDRLLSDRGLVAIMWLIGINALAGNVFVLAWKQKESSKNKVQRILLSNLAMSDLLMGVYMLMIASADIYFGADFPLQAESWRSGITCRVAGAISIISSEASVFFVMLISIDRFMHIRHPHSKIKLGERSAFVAAAVTWTPAILFGIIPSFLAGRDYRFYDNSHVCIGLPLAKIKMYQTEEISEYINIEGILANYKTTYFISHSKGYVNGLYFSSAIFLGLNFLCYLIVLACYVTIVYTVYRSSKRAGLNKDMKEQIRLTAKVAAIVITDFMCWFPVIVLGFLVQAGVLILPPSVFAWSVTFILPINSAINPYLYTIAAICNSRIKRRVGLDTSNSQQGSTLRVYSRMPGTQLQTISTVQQPSSAISQCVEPNLLNVPDCHGNSESNV